MGHATRHPTMQSAIASRQQLAAKRQRQAVRTSRRPLTAVPRCVFMRVSFGRPQYLLNCSAEQAREGVMHACMWYLVKQACKQAPHMRTRLRNKAGVPPAMPLGAPGRHLEIAKFNRWHGQLAIQ